MRLKRTILWFLAEYAVILTWLLLTPMYVHRPAFDAAFVAWSSNPNPETVALLEQERQRTHLERYWSSATLAFVVALATWALCRVIGELRQALIEGPPRSQLRK
jgi:hypothetical protein